MKPLEGIRVVDVSFFIAGPYCGQLLADMGADVVKVEPPEGDPHRAIGAPTPGPVPVGSHFLGLNRGKRSIALDLRHPEGRRVLHRLAASADVFLHAFRPPTAARLGLSYEAIRRQNPAIVY
ncbi:MAG: CoA transferase, partial [Clostridia bacterium]|nr:CoA transferase [Clostridia bacterium]